MQRGFRTFNYFRNKKAVSELCRISSKFIYLTTRFHPKPISIYDSTTEFEVDPTHITCLNQDLLRLMFVLEGYKSRPDLRKKMDWLNKKEFWFMKKNKFRNKLKHDVVLGYHLKHNDLWCSQSE